MGQRGALAARAVLAVSLPVLALLVSRRAPEEVLPLLAALTRHCSPLVPDVGVPPAKAALSTDASLGAPIGLPLALWVGSVSDLSMGAAVDAEVVLTRDEQVLAEVGDRALWVPVTRAPAGSRPISPFVRSRLRAARGLPADVVVDDDHDELRWPHRAAALLGDEIDTALACAGSVVALGAARVLRSLAWGTATVTDLATATEIRAVDGVHLRIAHTATTRRQLAEDLAADDSAAAALGWQGRLLVEQRHDVDRAAAVLARRLGLIQARIAPLAGPLALLAELGTPPDARVRARMADAVRALTSPGSRP